MCHGKQAKDSSVMLSPLLGLQKRWGHGYPSGQCLSLPGCRHLPPLWLTAGKSHRQWKGPADSCLQDEPSPGRVQSARCQGRKFSHVCLAVCIVSLFPCKLLKWWRTCWNSYCRCFKMVGLWLGWFILLWIAWQEPVSMCWIWCRLIVWSGEKWKRKTLCTVGLGGVVL